MFYKLSLKDLEDEIVVAYFNEIYEDEALEFLEALQEETNSFTKAEISQVELEEK